MNSGAVAALVDEDRRKPMKVFAAQAVMLELAQMQAYHLDDRDTALGIVEPLRQSSFPLHATLATALKGQWDEDTSVGDKLLRETIRTARLVGLGRAADFAAQLLSRPVADRHGVELVFPYGAESDAPLANSFMGSRRSKSPRHEVWSLAKGEIIGAAP